MYFFMIIIPAVKVIILYLRFAETGVYISCWVLILLVFISPLPPHRKEDHHQEPNSPASLHQNQPIISKWIGEPPFSRVFIDLVHLCAHVNDGAVRFTITFRISHLKIGLRCYCPSCQVIKMEAVFCLYMIDFGIGKCGAHWFAGSTRVLICFPPPTSWFYHCQDRQTFPPLGLILLSVILLESALKSGPVSDPNFPELSTENVFVDGLFYLFICKFRDKNSAQICKMKHWTAAGAGGGGRVVLGGAPVCSAAMDAVTMATLCSRSKILGRWFGPHP